MSLSIEDSVQLLSGAPIKRILPNVCGQTVSDIRNHAIALAHGDANAHATLLLTSQNSTSASAEAAQQQSQYKADWIRAYRARNSASSDVVNTRSFLSCTPDSVKQECLQNYIDATSSVALHKICCGACARRLFRHEFGKDYTVPLTSIPNSHQLIPDIPHPRMKLHDGLLLHEDGIDDNGRNVSICLSCWNSLERDSRPRASLAGGMWVGEIPSELAALTMPEQLLVGLAFPRTYLVKLYPKARGTNTDIRGPQMPPDQLYDALSGNVCSLDMPHTELDDMLRGVKLPHPPSILTDLISIAWVGTFKVPPSYLRGLFGVS